MSKFMIKDREGEKMQVFQLQIEFPLYFYFAMLSAYAPYKFLLS